MYNGNMKFDLLNIHILNCFFDAAENKTFTSTWEIAKKYPWEDKPKGMTHLHTHEFYSKKTVMIGTRLKTMVEEGIMRCKIFNEGKKKETEWELVTDCVQRSKAKFPTGNKNCLFIKRKSEKWIAIEI